MRKSKFDKIAHEKKVKIDELKLASEMQVLGENIKNLAEKLKTASMSYT